MREIERGKKTGLGGGKSGGKKRTTEEGVREATFRRYILEYNSRNSEIEDPLIIGVKGNHKECAAIEPGVTKSIIHIFPAGLRCC